MPAMPTLTSLNDEWLHTGLREFASGPWAGRSAGDVLGLVRAEPDRVLLGLLALARDGDRLAGRTVVQALLGKLVTMAVADRRLPFDDLLAALWVRLATYPIERRPAKVAANLVLDARKDVLAEQRGLRAITSHVPSPSGPGAAAVLDAALAAGHELEPVVVSPPRRAPPPRRSAGAAAETSGGWRRGPSTCGLSRREPWPCENWKLAATLRSEWSDVVDSITTLPPRWGHE